MPRGGGNIQYVPKSPHVPSPLGAALQTLPSAVHSFLQAQAAGEQRLLTQQQIAASKTAQAATQQGIDAVAAVDAQASLALQGSLMDPANRALIESDPALQRQVLGVVGDYGMGPDGSGANAPQAKTALGAFEKKRQQALQTAAFREYRSSLAADPANADLLPRVDALSKLVLDSGLTPEQAMSTAQMIGLPRDQVERLNIRIAEANLRGVNDKRASDGIATQALVRQGLIPQGTEVYDGASEWVRTLSVLDRQYAQNRALQTQAHTNALKEDASKAAGAFNTLFVSEMVKLIPELAKPYEDANGNRLQRNPQEIASYVNQLAQQYGVQLVEVPAAAIQNTINRTTVTESAVADFQDVLQSGIGYDEALQGLRTSLGGVSTMTDEERRKVFGAVMERVPRPKRTTRPGIPSLTAPADAAAMIGGVAPRQVPAPMLSGETPLIRTQ